MVLHANRQPVIVNVVRKLLNDTGEEGLSAIFRQRCELLGDRRRCHATGNQSCGQCSKRTGILQPRIPGATSQFIGLPSPPRRVTRQRRR